MLRVFLAGVLSIIFPGIGQIYNGQWFKGILSVIELSLIYFVVPNMWIDMLFRVIWLYAVVDAIVIANLVRKGRERPVVLRGGKAVLGVGLSSLIIIPLALFSTYLPNIVFYLASQAQFQEPDVPEGQLEEEKELYEAYLQEKYNQTFILGDASYNSVDQHYTVEAYREENPDLHFVVFQDRNNEFYDTYLEERWIMDAKEHLQQLLQDMYPDIWVFNLDIHITKETEEAILDFNDKKIPDFIAGHKEYLDGYDYSVELVVFQDFTDQNKEEVLEKLFQGITYFQEHEINVRRFDIEYYNEDLLEENGMELEYNMVDYNDYASYFIHLSKDDLNNIQEPEHIEDYLVDLRE